MKKSKVLPLVETGVLAAVIILMAFTPIGYLKLGIIEITLITIPVVIGAMTVGPVSGLILGTVFGVTSFIQCFGSSPFGAALLNINPFFTFLVCVPTRALMGWLTGVIFDGLRKIDKTKTVSFFASGLIGALLNTIFFMGMLILLFWRTDYIQSIAASSGGTGVLWFLWAMVGVNGLVEMGVTCALGGGISKALFHIFHHSSDGRYV